MITRYSYPETNRSIEFFTASIRNRNTRMTYARAVKQLFDRVALIKHPAEATGLSYSTCCHRF